MGNKGNLTMMEFVDSNYYAQTRVRKTKKCNGKHTWFHFSSHAYFGERRSILLLLSCIPHQFSNLYMGVCIRCAWPRSFGDRCSDESLCTIIASPAILLDYQFK